MQIFQRISYRREASEPVICIYTPDPRPRLLTRWPPKDSVRGHSKLASAPVKSRYGSISVPGRQPLSGLLQQRKPIRPVAREAPEAAL